MPPQIVGLRGAHEHATFPLADAPTTFGRNPDNTIVVNSARSSRRHAEIRRDGSDFVIADLGSANGTVVNGQRITAPQRLRAGDTIEIGDDLFRFDAPALDATLIAAPAPQAVPTVPASQQQTPRAVPNTPPLVPQQPVQQPAQPQQPAQSPQPYPAQAIPPAPPRKSSGMRTVLIIAGLFGFVMLLACVGGAVAISRTGVFGLLTPTSAPAIRPTAETGSNQTVDDPQPTPEPVAGGADWTVLVYLDGDNNLEPEAVGDFNEMELAGSNENVNIVVQFDRITTDELSDDTSNGDWDGTKRYLVGKDDDEDEITSQELEDLGELNMGDPQTLADFITWGVREYPAQRYAVILWDHGASWSGIAFDDSSDQKGISLPELQSALRTAQSDTGVERFDLIGFDACLMAQLDVFQTIAPYGDVVVASAELEPGEGWAWDAWLSELNAAPEQDAATLADSIVRTYGEFYQDDSDDTPTLSAFDLSRTTELRDGFNAFSDAMIAGMGDSYSAIAEARSYVDAYSQPQPQEFNAIDLGHFAALVEEQGAADSIVQPAQALAQTIEQARIAEWHGGFHKNSTGISIYFPQVSELYPDFYEQASPLPQETSWANFLTTFYDAGTNQVTVPEITELTLSDSTAGINNPITVEGAVDGQDIAYVFFAVGVPGSGESIELTDVNFVYPPGTSPNNSVPPWDDGTNALSEEWDGTRWAISNGADTIPALFIPIKYGTNLFGVDGTYTRQGTGDEIDAGIIFEVSGNGATLRTIYGFPKGSQQESQPFEITPVAGDTFTVLQRTYAVRDGEPTYEFNQGETITFNQDPLSALKIPANSGDYVTGFLVTDISGRFNYDYQNLTVDNSGAGPVNVDPAQPTPGTGAQAGTLAYSNADLRFGIDYPDTWETLDTGNAKIFFYNPDPNSATFVSVDVYGLELSAEEANQSLVDSFAQSIDQEQDVTRSDIEDGQIAGLTGPGFTYAYTDQEGVMRNGFVIVVTNPDSGLSYVVNGQALSEDYTNDLNIMGATAGTLVVN